MSTDHYDADYRGPTYNITVSGSDDFSETFTVKDENGSAINLTGETWTASVKRKVTDTSAALSFTVDGTNYASGEVTITLTDTQIATLLPAGVNRFAGVWSLKRLDGGLYKTWCRGDFIVDRRPT